AGIFIQVPYSRRDLDLLALYPHRLCAIVQESPKRALRLEADQQHGSFTPPQPKLQMMPDATGLAHAASRDDDVKAVQPGDRLALVDRLGESQLRRGQEPIQVDLGIETCRVSAEHLSR